MIRRLIVCMFLIFATLAIYRQVIEFEFLIWDDTEYVVQNEMVQAGLTIKGCAWAFSTMSGANWFPLTWIAHMLDCQLYGLNPGGHHLTNVLIHILNGLLLFGLFKHMTGQLWPGAMVSLLFALHPLHGESVAWVSQRKELLSFFLGLLSLHAYVAYVKDGGLRRYGLVFILFTLALMAKPMLVTLPALLLLLDYWPLHRIGHATHRVRPPHSPSWKGGKWRGHGTRAASPTNTGPTFVSLLIEKMPLLALSAVSCLVTFVAQRGGGAVAPTQAISIHLRLFNAIVSYVRYMGKMIWPTHLSAFYPHPNLPGGTPWSAWEIIGAAGLLLVISILAIRASRRYLIVGWLWYLIALVPVIGLVQVGAQAMADRYSYVPLTGLFIMVAWSGEDLIGIWSRIEGLVRSCVIAGSAAAVGLCMVISGSQVGYWKNTIDLFEHALEVAPEAAMPNNNLGIALRQRRELDKAISHFRKAIAINGEYSHARNNLGHALLHKREFDEARMHLERALQRRPDFPEAHNNLGLVMRSTGDHEGAIDHYRKALEIKPRYGEAHYNLGVELVLFGQFNAALVHFSQAARILPYEPTPLNGIAWILATHPDTGPNEVDIAVRLAERAAALTQEQDASILDTLAAAYAATGQFERAVAVAQVAIQLAIVSNAYELASQIRSRQKLYQDSNPYREAPRS